MNSLVKHMLLMTGRSHVMETLETKVKLVFIEYTMTYYGIIIAHYLGDVLRMNCNHNPFSLVVDNGTKETRTICRARTQKGKKSGSSGHLDSNT